jgi:hypothetical protein
MESPTLKLPRICLLLFMVFCGMARTTLAASTFASALSFAQAIKQPGVSTPVTFTLPPELDEDPSSAFADSAAVAIDQIAASTTGEARATYGDIGLHAVADVNGGSDQLQSGGEARTTLEAEWTDRIVLTVPFLPHGDEIKVVGKISTLGSFFPPIATGPISLPGFSTAGSVSGSLSIQTFNSTGSVHAGPGCSFVFRVLSPLSSDPLLKDINVNDIGNNFVEWGLPNGIGTTIRVNGKLSVRATAGASTEAHIDGQFIGSIHWGGIESVTNAATGEVLTGWTITSESGFDYSQPFPVPEPTSLLLVEVELGTLMATQWRRLR